MFRKVGKCVLWGGSAFCSYALFDAYRNREYSSTTRPLDRQLRVQKAVDDNDISFPLKTMRYFAVSVINLGKYLVLEKMNTVKLIGKENILQYMNREKGVGMITVCNHQSSIDDPFVVSLLFDKIHLNELYKKPWSTCSEEYGFNHSFTSFILSTGKVLPVKRGGGINHISFLDIIQKVNAGQWVHIFPEGKTWQNNAYIVRDKEGCLQSKSGRKAPPGRLLGPLKWGVGKLVGDSDKTPVVIPFYHMGMEKIYPLDAKNANTYLIPRTGNTLYVIVGKAIPLRNIVDKYKPLINKETNYQKKQELQHIMYKEITDTIDHSLECLEKQCLLEIQKDQHPIY
ncbi:hypothetical protein WA158_008061 [Blastocystis sp. Blastoise]